MGEGWRCSERCGPHGRGLAEGPVSSPRLLPPLPAGAWLAPRLRTVERPDHDGQELSRSARRRRHDS